ncbi:copper chaperone PCu(A)C [Trinickia dinghuensis]|uniref:Copper chaperone PCu(A)C n=1 Tax=Trinickia dinghuensis TaxID=2291023 RepID=A0A3D8JYR4_9BURK|nr:copper chaperone PCu(A)C [Trinickia dinghuensis]RDU97765.1 copper chaperone PCu(A)C [Trinickia dinghuensis]
MKSTMKKVLLPLALCFCAAPVLAAPASVMVSDCWVRLLPGTLPSGGYFSVMNMSDKPVNLVGVDTDAFGMAMLHQTKSNGSTTTMVMVDKAAVPANGTLKFAPGGYHLMLEQPKHPLKVGTSIQMTFKFDDGEKVSSECAVKSAGAMGD